MKRNSVRALSSLVIVLNLASPLVYGVGGFKFSEKNLDLNFKTITYDNLELSPQRLSVINNFLMMATIAWEPKENMHYWNPKLEKVRKKNNSSKYLSRFIFLLFNYKRWFINKKGRNEGLQENNI